MTVYLTQAIKMREKRDRERVVLAEVLMDAILQSNPKDEKVTLIVGRIMKKTARKCHALNHGYGVLMDIEERKHIKKRRASK